MASYPSAGSRPPKGTPRRPKDLWDKGAVLLHPVGGLLTAVAVGVVGIRGSHMLEKRQSIDSNARLYSELMSRREEAETSLRKDMLVSIIQTFLEPGSQDLDTKVLNLELLAYNFHDSLNLEPLFLDMQRKLATSSDGQAVDYRRRVNRVAREITNRQMFSLEGHGKSFHRMVDLEELAARGKSGVALDPEMLTIEDKTFEVNLRALEVDPKLEQVRVRLEVREPKAESADTRATFDVGFFDFPIIDNTRLANGVRCSVTLGAFSEANADLATICFPGEFASLRDRPYYDEVIRQLHQASTPD